MAMICLRQGRAEEGLDYARKSTALQRDVTPIAGNMAMIRNALGDPGGALEYLERAVEEHNALVLKVNDPAWEPYRKDHRFQAALRKMKLTP
jgi:hypothetical protein